MFGEGKKKNPFIGLSKSKVDDMWYWIDGVKARKNSSFWSENRPSPKKNHHCGSLNKLDAEIKSRYCTKQNATGLCAFDILSSSVKTDI